MRRNLFQSISSELEKYLKKGDKVVIGLSGGRDSVALLHTLIRSPLALSIFACHFNHYLRKNSETDQKFVESLCRANKIPLYVKKLDIKRASRHLNKGIEETGRVFRRKFLENIQMSTGSKHILLAHHSDDQIETFFMRLLRGSSLKGLQSIKILEGPYFRPMISFTKNQITDFLISENLDWIEDESNSDIKYTRNNIRENLIPLLKQFNPNLNSIISNTLQMIAEQNKYIDERLSGLEPSLIKEVSDYEFVASIQDILNLSDFEIKEILYRFFLTKIGPKDFISFRNIDDILRLIKSSSASWEFLLTNNIKIEKGYNFLCIKTQKYMDPVLDLNILCEGVWENDNLEIKITKENFDDNLNYVFFDLSKMKFPISVRNVQDGDRMKLKGMRSPKKLQDIFIDNKIPRFIRARLPVFESEGKIFHIHGVNINSSLRLKTYQENSIGISVKSTKLDKLIQNINS